MHAPAPASIARPSPPFSDTAPESREDWPPFPFPPSVPWRRINGRCTVPAKGPAIFPAHCFLLLYFLPPSQRGRPGIKETFPPGTAFLQFAHPQIDQSMPADWHRGRRTGSPSPGPVPFCAAHPACPGPQCGTWDQCPPPQNAPAKVHSKTHAAWKWMPGAAASAAGADGRFLPPAPAGRQCAPAFLRQPPG